MLWWMYMWLGVVGSCLLWCVGVCVFYLLWLMMVGYFVVECVFVCVDDDFEEKKNFKMLYKVGG